LGGGPPARLAKGDATNPVWSPGWAVDHLHGRGHWNIRAAPSHAARWYVGRSASSRGAKWR
jgi:hypothetical protein